MFETTALTATGGTHSIQRPLYKIVLHRSQRLWTDTMARQSDEDDAASICDATCVTGRVRCTTITQPTVGATVSAQNGYGYLVLMPASSSAVGHCLRNTALPYRVWTLAEHVVFTLARHLVTHFVTLAGMARVAGLAGLTGLDFGHWFWDSGC